MRVGIYNIDVWILCDYWFVPSKYTAQPSLVAAILDHCVFVPRKSVTHFTLPLPSTSPRIRLQLLHSDSIASTISATDHDHCIRRSLRLYDRTPPQPSSATKALLTQSTKYSAAYTFHITTPHLPRQKSSKHIALPISSPLRRVEKCQNHDCKH